MLYTILWVLPLLWSNAFSVEISDQNERIMEVILVDGTVMNQGIIVYGYEQDWYVPLFEFSQSLGISVKSSGLLGVAEGYILSEQRPFQMDTRNCVAYVNNQSVPYDCSYALVYRSEIYLSLRLYQVLFPVNVEVDLYRSQMIIHPRELLPIQYAREREQLVERMKYLTSQSDPGFPLQPASYSVLDGFSTDQQFHFYKEIQNQDSHTELQYSNLTTFEVLGLDSQFSISGTLKKPSSSKFTLARRSAEGGILGPLDLRQIEVFDVELLPLPMISPALLGRGFVLSAFPLHSPVLFDTQDFTGFLAPGWEVLLYQNGFLIGRQISSPTNRYEFRKIPLLYGRNYFQLAFFGPQGQKKNEFLVVHINENLAPPGQFRYRVGAIQNTGSAINSQVQMDMGITKQLSLTSGALALSSEKEIFGFFGFNFFFKSVLVSSQMAADPKGGKAWESKMQTELFPNIFLGGSYTRFFSYQSLLYNRDASGVLLHKTTALIRHPALFLPAQVIWEGTKLFYLGGAHQTELKNKLVLATGSLFWHNELNFIWNQNESSVPPTGKLDLTYLPWESQIRFGLGYDTQSFTLLEGEVTTKFSDYYSIQVGVQYPIYTKTPSYNVNLSRMFNSFTLGMDLSYRNSSDYAYGILCSFSLAADPHSPNLHFSGQPQAAQGATSVHVFFDENRNSKRDEYESDLPDVGVLVGGRSTEIKTNEKGRVFLSHLEPYRPIDVSLVLRSIKNPFLKPEPPGVRFYSRPGKTIEVNMPVVLTGEIEGFIRLKRMGDLIPVVKTQVVLLDEFNKQMASTLSDSDGHFLFQNLNKGNYIIDIAPSPSLINYRIEPEQYQVMLNADNAVEIDKDFTIYAQ